ncbi:MAG: hypothetical protein KDD67_11175 [Ignavibacteriae bacterium]|nr:hypothetical protein [Ignavibacteriota bacterium]MCB9215850.1 hypothetical protein [Ignavibacteria bacterium]
MGRRDITLPGRLLFTIAIVLLIGRPLRAQVPSFPDSLHPQSLVTRTERFASTHNASLGFNYEISQAPFTGLFKTYVLSSTTLLGSPVTRDQVDLMADMQYELPSPVNLFLLIEGTMSNDIGADELIPGLNNTAVTFAGIGGRAEDQEGNRAAIAVGGAYNRQLNTEDAGGGFYGDIAGHKTIGGYNISLAGNGRWHNTSPRINGNLLLNTSLDRDFGDGVYLSALADWEVDHDDLYIRRREEDILQYGGETFEGILKRRERSFRFTSFLLYPVSDRVGFDVDVSVVSNGIGRLESEEGLPPTPREPEPYEFNQQDGSVGGSFGSWYSTPALYLTARLNYRTSQQENLVDPVGDVPEVELRRKRKTSAFNDYLSSYLQFAGTAEYRLGRHDTLGVNGSIGIYRYDTPDTTNYFDKDEKTVTSEFRYARRFSRLLWFQTTGQVFLTHLVYLFGQNSNDNNWNRLIRLSPTVHYHFPEVMENRLEAELTANYTDYDFEGRTQNIRGRSFRELAIRDSLVLYLSRKYGLVAAGELRVAERGSFSWKDFAESLLERARTELVEMELFSGRDSTAQFGFGGKLSRVRTFRADPRGEMLPFSDRTSIGPTVHISLPVTERTRLEADGWWEHRFDESELVGKTPWLFLTLDLKL